MIGLADLEQYLADHGYKMTRQRRNILRGLLYRPGWKSAREIHRDILAQNQRVDYSTIYRNLDALTTIGILCRVERADAVNYYNLNQASGHHHHLVCRSCHKITELNYCPLSRMNPDSLQNFTEVECKFELYGYCHECQQKNKGPAVGGRG